MSDNYGGEEYEMEWPDDGQPGDGWGDDNEEGENGPGVEIENLYWTAEGNMKQNPKEAIGEFEECVKKEMELGDEITWRFKAMENIVVLCARLGECEKMRDYQGRILKIMDKVARNDVSDAINNILDAVSKHLEKNLAEQQVMYTMTLDILKKQNQQLWFTICLRLGKIYLDQGKFPELDALLTVLKESSKKQKTDGDGD